MDGQKSIITKRGISARGRGNNATLVRRVDRKLVKKGSAVSRLLVGARWARVSCLAAALGFSGLPRGWAQKQKQPRHHTAVASCGACNAAAEGIGVVVTDSDLDAEGDSSNVAVLN